MQSALVRTDSAAKPHNTTMSTTTTTATGPTTNTTMSTTTTTATGSTTMSTTTIATTTIGAATASLVDLTGDVRVIEKNTVAVSSRGSYICTLANLMVFLFYGDYKSTLTASAIASINQAIKDNENVKKKRKRDGYENFQVYEESKRLLGLMERSKEQTIPIILVGENEKTTNHLQINHVCPAREMIGDVL